MSIIFNLLTSHKIEICSKMSYPKNYFFELPKQLILKKNSVRGHNFEKLKSFVGKKIEQA